MQDVGGTTKTSRTNQNGVFIFTLMQPGSYSITATYSSSATVTMTAVAKQIVIAAVSLP